MAGINEQWLSYGDCDKCRRKNYCGTQCKPHRARVQRNITSACISMATEIVARALSSNSDSNTEN